MNLRRMNLNHIEHKHECIVMVQAHAQHVNGFTCRTPQLHGRDVTEYWHAERCFKLHHDQQPQSQHSTASWCTVHAHPSIFECVDLNAGALGDDEVIGAWRHEVAQKCVSHNCRLLRTRHVIVHRH